jgi:hypothetical protein
LDEQSPKITSFDSERFALICYAWIRRSIPSGA